MSDKPEKAKKLKGLAKKILGDEDRRDPKEVLSSLVEMGDKARMETVRLLAKEVRGYLEAMEIHKDVNELLTNYSLEVSASFRLKPLNEQQKDAKKSEEISSEEKEDKDED